jgi:choline-sulfatase/uncharacterized sulfatase
MNHHLNVLFIVADQHLATCLGCDGHPQVLTPNLDRLARSGVRFRHAYTQSPICTPSRVSFHSGQYCHNHGYYGLSGPAPKSLPSFFSHFRAHGYRTGGIGNLHTPDDPRNWLGDHLDVFLDSYVSVDGAEDETPFYDKLRALGLEEQEDHMWWRAHPDYCLEGFPSALPFELSQEGWSAHEAIRFMDKSNDAPFCLEVSLLKPHHPFAPAREFWEMYPDDLELPPTFDADASQRAPHFQDEHKYGRQQVPWPIEPQTFEAGARRLWRAYLACITHTDHAVGLLLDYLEQSDLDQNTLVIYSADHGAYSGTHGLLEKAPGICSEAVCRVPAIWRVPEVTSPDSICHQLIEHVDIAPTLAALCALPPMETADGRDISTLLRGEEVPVHEVAVTEHPWSKSLRWKQWRFVHYQSEMFEGRNIGELYNIETDPDETINLYHATEYREVVAQCRKLLLEWLIGTARAVTVWPAVEATALPYHYRTAQDGKESNQAGPRLRLQRKQLNYL